MLYYFFYIIALLSLSQASIIVRWSATDPLLLGAWRLLAAGSILLIWSKIYLPNIKADRANVSKIIAAGFAFFIHLFSYAYSAHHTSISHLMLIFSLNPVTTAFGSWIFFKERMTQRQALSYLLALLGIAILAKEKLGSGNLGGDLMALAAALTFSAYALLSKWARRDLPNSVFAARMYLAGSAFFFITLLIFGHSYLPSNSKAWMGICLLTLFPTLLGHGIFTLSLKHIPLSVLSLGKLIEPVLASMSAFLIFGEQLSSAAFISFGLIVTAVILVVLPAQSRKN